MGGGPNKNLSALSLALMTMQVEENKNNDNGGNGDRSAKTKTRTSSVEKRRAALHNAPPSAVGPTGVGDYGYAYNSNHNSGHNSGTHQNHNQYGLSASPTTTLGTTPPGYLLGVTPGTIGATPGSYGGLIPPARSSSLSNHNINNHLGAANNSSSGNVLAPPFVRLPGFAGKATAAIPPEANPPDGSTDAAASNLSGAATPSPHHRREGRGVVAANARGDVANSNNKNNSIDPKPSLDLLHSSPFHHHSVVHGGPGDPRRDGLSSFLQAEETASMEAATTFINDFYHHHYPMASAGGDEGGNGNANLHSTEDHYHYYHHSGVFGGGAATQRSSSMAEGDGGDDLLLQAEDMPFAVDGLSSGLSLSPHPGAGAVSMGFSSRNANANPNAHGSVHEASLMAASVCMVPPKKKLALFESTATAAADGGIGNSNNNDNHRSIETLTDQLEDFRSFGASLSLSTAPSQAGAAAVPLTTSVGSGG